MKKELRRSLFFLGLFLFFTLLYSLGVLEDFDQVVWQFFEQIGNPFLFFIAQGCSFFASLSFFVPVTILLLCFFKNRKINCYLLINLVGSTVVTQLLKLWIHRERAIPFFGSVPHDYSYPSGHTVAAICFYSFLYSIVQKRVQKKKLRIGLQALFLFFLIMIPISRLLLGVHYLSDVIASFLFSFFYLNALFCFFQKVEKEGSAL